MGGWETVKPSGEQLAELGAVQQVDQLVEFVLDRHHLRLVWQIGNGHIDLSDTHRVAGALRRDGVGHRVGRGQRVDQGVEAVKLSAQFGGHDGCVDLEYR